MRRKKKTRKYMKSPKIWSRVVVRCLEKLVLKNWEKNTNKDRKSKVTEVVKKEKVKCEENK